MSERTLLDDLARYIDNEAFVAKRIGKEKAAHMAARRANAKKRAKTALRFFTKPENRVRLDRYTSHHAPKDTIA